MCLSLTGNLGREVWYVCVSHVPGPGIQEGLVDLALDLTHGIRDDNSPCGLCLEGEEQAARYQTPLL